VQFFNENVPLYLLLIYFLSQNEQLHHHMENREVVGHNVKFVITCFIVYLHNMGKREVKFEEKNFITHVMHGNL
jgi:hypothetical protein